MALPRLEPTGRVGDQVFEAIHNAILGGELPAGYRLRVRDLADDLGTSVMPVREAIRRLEEIGLAHAVPYRGAVVKEFTNTELLDLYAVRRTLETEATIRGATHLTDSDIARMAAECAAMADSVATRDAAGYLAHDEAFLTIIYAASGNSVLVELINTLWRRCRTYKAVGARRAMEAGDTHSLLTYQSDLLLALRERDAERAGQLTAASIDAAIERIEKALEEPPAG
jgi:DNA-binding GntR family transcriptional regulator